MKRTPSYGLNNRADEARYPWSEAHLGEGHSNVKPLRSFRIMPLQAKTKGVNPNRKSRSGAPSRRPANEHHYLPGNSCNPTNAKCHASHSFGSHWKGRGGDPVAWATQDLLIYAQDLLTGEDTPAMLRPQGGYNTGGGSYEC